LETFITGTLCNNGKAAGSATSQDAENGLLVPIIAGTMKSCASGGGQSNSADHAVAGYMIPVAFSGIDNGRDATKNLTPTLRKGGDGAYGQAMAVAFDAYNQATSDITHTLRRGTGSSGDAIPQTISGMRVRRLTPRECERLQGFPDDYTLVPNRGKPAADGPRYKALGNSMAVPVMRWIGERIAKMEALS
jgi:DNA (cytosine-5)-methyltransferase 1